MSEYIKKEEAMQAIQDHFDQGGFGNYQDGQDMMRRITELQGIEIVPCDECVYSQSAEIDLNGYELEAMWCDFNECYVHKTDFCSMGEKQ